MIIKNAKAFVDGSFQENTDLLWRAVQMDFQQDMKYKKQHQV